MGRCSSSFAVALLLLAVSLFAGCGSSRTAGPSQPPGVVTIAPGTNVSLDIGAQLQFTASATNGSGTPISVSISFLSSNTAVLTVANSGLACAGSWNSLVSPTVCTPGPSGVATVTATSNGLSSPPTTVYVHEHVDNLSIVSLQPPVAGCLSQDQTGDFQAVASTRGRDITSTVGPLNWVQANSTIVKLDTHATGLLSTQVRATAANPGRTQLTISAAGVVSSPFTFDTCPVQSITLSVTDQPGTSFSIAKGSTKTITATVLDTQGVTLTSPPITWTSSDPTRASVSSAGVVLGSLVGGADIIATCTPNSCNAGIVPLAPVYPNAAISIQVTPTTGTGTESTTAYVTSTGCGTNFNCGTNVFPISVPGNQFSSGTPLPHAPNSFLFNRQGTHGYLGSDKGLMVLDPASSPPAVSAFDSFTGKVLAVAPNGNLVVLSDTQKTPNQVYIFNDALPTTVVNFLITGATAAAFSPDNLKAYIVAGSNLYVYSSLEPLKTIPLAASAADVTFLPAGSFGYLAGGDPAGVEVRDTCTDNHADAVATHSTPTAIRALQDGVHLIALESPGVNVITATPATSGGPPPDCGIVSNSVSDFINLGQGDFTPTQFLVATDGTKAYIVAGNLGSILVYDVASGASSALPLTGNATPISGDISADGTMIYAGASDGAVHAVSTISGGDVQQISLPAGFNLCSNVSFTCLPDLVAVKP